MYREVPPLLRYVLRPTRRSSWRNGRSTSQAHKLNNFSLRSSEYPFTILPMMSECL